MRSTIVILFFFIISNAFCQQGEIIDIKIKGAKKIKISFIKNLIKSDNSLVLDSVQLEKDIVLLKRLPAISHAYYQVFHSHKNKYNVFIIVEENFTLIPDFNLWTTTNRQTAYKVGLYEYNFLGRNIAIGGFYQNNGFDSYGLNIKAPTLFSDKWGLSLSHQNWASEEPLYFDDQSANYKYQNISYEVLGLYDVNFKNRLEFGFNVFKEKYNYLSGATSTTIPQQLNVNKLLFKTVYTFDNLDYYFQYVNGFKSVFYGQFVKSDNMLQDDFLIAWNDFFYYKRVKEKGNWANRLRIGFASNNESPFAPFSLDNNVNLRGVGILVDRGTAVITLNSEYRHTLYEKSWFILQSNAFVDAGSWRKPGGELNDLISSENARVYTGVGLRFINKKIFNAVFRIDYGYGVTEGASQGFVFGIGQYF